MSDAFFLRIARVSVNPVVMRGAEQKISVGIFGASGYVGYELVQWLDRHPRFALQFATGESSAGQRLSELYPTTRSLQLISTDEAPLEKIDLAFLCLPHASPQAMAVIRKLVQAEKKIVDLSGDFRLQNTDDYHKWYGHDHAEKNLLKKFIYGLPELNREKIHGARYISNPGCYPTSAALGLLPFSHRKELLGDGPIVIDSKSGISGAGRKAAIGSLFAELSENIRPYSIGHAHRHYPEIRQTLTQALGREPTFVFTPQVLPVIRGILSNIYVPLAQPTDSQALRAQFKEFYSHEKFVTVLDEGKQSQLNYVTGTNQCVISLEVHGTMAIITSCIDNLVKGAAGQAIQNANLMVGLEEGLGLC